MKIRDNLLPRLRLARIALTRRFIYDDLVALARGYGIAYGDVRADTEPFEFVRRLGGWKPDEPSPDFGRAIEPAQAFTPADAPIGFNSEPSVGRFLGELVFRRRARVVIELGCFVGWVSAHLALALRTRGEGRLYCLDYHRPYLDRAMANLERHGLAAWASPVCGLSLDDAVRRALPEPADVIFLDTSHTYPATRDEVLAYAPRLAPGGCLVLHDSLSAPGVRRSLLDLDGRFRLLTFATEQGNGLTVLFRHGE